MKTLSQTYANAETRDGIADADIKEVMAILEKMK